MGNFQGRKSSRISRFYIHPRMFSPLNFRHATSIMHFNIPWKFSRSTKCSLPTNQRKFSPSKVSLLYYMKDLTTSPVIDYSYKSCACSRVLLIHSRPLMIISGIQWPWQTTLANLILLQYKVAELDKIFLPQWNPIIMVYLIQLWLTWETCSPCVIHCMLAWLLHGL